MEELKKTFILFCYGLIDFICGVCAIKNLCFKTYPKLQPRTLLGVLKPCIAYGALFWAGITIYSHIILNYGVTYFESFLEPDERAGVTWFVSFLDIIFNTVWILPNFLVSKCLNFIWYQEIADLTFISSGIKKGPPVRFSYEISDQIQSFLIQCFFMGQVYIMLWLPSFVPEIIKHILFNVQLSLLYAWYSFEYKWVKAGWNLNKRLAYMNAKWPYFLGFGFPLAFTTSYLFASYSESICYFSFMFPMFLVSSIVTSDSRIQNYGFPIQFFKPTYRIVDFVTVQICTFLRTFLRPAR